MYGVISKLWHKDRYAILTNKFFYIIFLNSLLYWGGNLYLDYTNRGFMDFVATLQWRQFGDLVKILYRCFILYFILCFSLSLCVNEKIYRYIESLLVLLSFSIGCINIFLLINFFTLINPIFIGVFLSTNIREATEFIQMYMPIKTLSILGFFIILSVCLTYKQWFAWQLRTSVNFVIYVLCLVFLVFAFLSNKPQYFETRFIQNNSMLHFATTLYNSLHERHEEITQYANLSKNMQDFLESILLDSKNTNGGVGANLSSYQFS